MKFTQTSYASRPEFMGSADWEAIPFTFTEDTAAGLAVAVTDGLGNAYYGINAYDVTVDDNPNGAVIVAGIINTDKLPDGFTSTGTMFPTLVFLPKSST